MNPDHLMVEEGVLVCLADKGLVETEGHAVSVDQDTGVAVAEVEEPAEPAEYRRSFVVRTMCSL